ncbi:MAG: hypothetical protein AAGE94_18670 [Acidobacteriota bacterium]
MTEPATAPPQDPAPPQNPAQSAPPPHDHTIHAARRRAPGLAAALSFFLPGFGNIYNGLFQRGLAIFATTFCIFFVAVSGDDGPILALLVPSMLFVWLFGIFDSYRQATLINYGVTQEDLDVLPARDSGGMVAGIAFFLIGLYGLLHEVFGFDLSALFDYWYLILMAFGGWLAFQGWKAKQGADAAGSDDAYADL